MLIVIVSSRHVVFTEPESRLTKNLLIGEIESSLCSLEPMRVSPAAAVRQELDPDEGRAGASTVALDDEEDVSVEQKCPIAPIGRLTVTQRFRSDEVRVIWREHELK